MIVGFFGAMGSSKTLSLVRRVYMLHKAGYKVYSNMHFEFDYEPLTIKDLLTYTSDSDKFENAVIVIDEIHIWVDSRRSISTRNVIISYFLTQTRKKSVKLFYTSQHRHQVDKRLKSNTDVFIDCSKIPLGDVLIAVNDVTLQDNRQTREWFIGNEYFHLYDTNQTISIIDEED